MDANTLSAVMGGALPVQRYRELLPSYERAMRVAGATTIRRAAMFAAQIGHESGGLRYQSEIWGPTSWQMGYEGRRDLGNTQPGDGSRFRGHGWIQVTGRHNHTEVSRWAFSKGLVPSADFFVRDPAALGSDSYAWLGAAWYWGVARPTLNSVSDAGDVVAATRLINGGTNGLDDRRLRYQRALQWGEKLLPAKAGTENGGSMAEKVLPYSRAWVGQDTFYNCGPASMQTIVLSKTGKLVGESEIGRRLGTHTGGTDYIGQFPVVMNYYLPGAGYKHADMPNDPPTGSQKSVLWERIVSSVDAGYGVVANIVAPPSNYPRAVAPSTISPAYRGGTVYHYFAVMGYAGSGNSRRVWVADSGFSPFGYWLSFNQLASLIPPKGYAYATAKATPPKKDTKKETSKVDKAQADRIERLLTLILDQLAGPARDAKGHKFTGWPQLGGKTLVDAVADIRKILNKEGK